MFYSQFLLSKKGPLGVIWIAAHLERKLKKKQITETDISESIDQILKADVPIALRLSSHLLIGVVRIFAKKVDYLFNDCSEALLKIRQAYRSNNIDLPPKALIAPYHTITLPDSFDFDHLGDYINDDDVARVGTRADFDHHVTSRDLITLQEPYADRHSLYTFDGDFLEGSNPYMFSTEDGVHTGRVSMGGGARFEASYEDVLPPLPLPMEEEMGLFNAGRDEEHQVSSEWHTEQTVSCSSPPPEFELDVKSEALTFHTKQTVSCSSPAPEFQMDVHPETLGCQTEQTVSYSSPPEFQTDVHIEAQKCHAEQSVSHSSPPPESQMDISPESLKCSTEKPMSCVSPIRECEPDVQTEVHNITTEVIECQATPVEKATVHSQLTNPDLATQQEALQNQPPLPMDVDNPVLGKQEVTLQNQPPQQMDLDKAQFAQEGSIEVLLHINVETPKDGINVGNPMNGKDSSLSRFVDDAAPLTEPIDAPQTPKAGKVATCVSRRPITRQMTTTTPRIIATPEEDALGSLLGVRRPYPVTSTPESQRKQKRKKVIFDCVQVIPNGHMKKQLGSTADICRPRTKAPSTKFDNHIEKKMTESLVPGMCIELKELFQSITSKVCDSHTDVSETIRNRRKRARFVGSDLDKSAEMDASRLQKEDIFPNVKRRIEFHQRTSVSVDVHVNLMLSSTSAVGTEHGLNTTVDAVAVTSDKVNGAIETTETLQPDKPPLLLSNAVCNKSNEDGEHGKGITNEVDELHHVAMNENGECDNATANDQANITANETGENNHVTANDTNETGEHENTAGNQAVEHEAAEHDNTRADEENKADYVNTNVEVHVTDNGDHRISTEAVDNDPCKSDQCMVIEGLLHDCDIANAAGETSSDFLGVSEDHLSSQNVAYSLGESSDHLGFSFLSDSREIANGAVTDSCDAYSYHIGNICEDQTGWASRTRAVAEYLKCKFESMDKERGVKLELDLILKGRRKKEAARMFFETLVLKSSGYIEADQEGDFSNIQILPTEQLMSTVF